jgi:hypothetical protein
VEATLADHIQQLYEHTITEGAHPDVSSVLSQVSTSEDRGDHWFVKVGAVHEPRHPQMESALLECVKYALVVAYINVRSRHSYSGAQALTECSVDLHSPPGSSRECAVSASCRLNCQHSIKRAYSTTYSGPAGHPPYSLCDEAGRLLMIYQHVPQPRGGCQRRYRHGASNRRWHAARIGLGAADTRRNAA